jgi:hypothetical protein
VIVADDESSLLTLGTDAKNYRQFAFFGFQADQRRPLLCSGARSVPVDSK